MNKNILISLLFFFITAGVSCSKDWLEAKVDKAQAVPETVSDFQAMLDDFTEVNVNSTIFSMEIAADGHYYTDAVWNNMKGTDYQNKYTWTNDVQLENGLSDWNSPYLSILIMNVILDELEKSGIRNTIEGKEIKGQALFHRSRYFLSLAEAFSPPYQKSTANIDFGIPLRVSSDINLPTIRTSVLQTYDRIVNDLKVAIELLPLSQSVLTRASRPAAAALLARTYLTMEEYDSSLAYADKCLALKADLLDYNTIPTNSKYIGVNPEVIFLNFFPLLSQLTSDYLVDSLLYREYDENDLRRTVFFSNVGGIIRFKGTYGNSETNIFSGLSTDEVYLIKAECLARRGDFAAGIDVLNSLLKTRWKRVAGTSTYVNKNVSSKLEALRVIIQERRKQLILRNTRWADLRRLNKEEEFALTVTRVVAGKAFVLEPNSYKYTFPIPDDIIKKTGIQQNVGWEK